MSHTKLSKLPIVLKNLQKNVGKNKICIDTDDCPIKNNFGEKKIFIKKDKIVKIFNDDHFSNDKNIYLYPKFKLLSVPKNTKIFVGFDGIILKIIKKN